MKWTWPWNAAAETYAANRYAKAREDTERRYMEAGGWGTGVVSDIQGMWLNFTKWPTTIFSGLTGICWEREDEPRAELPEHLEGTELAEGYRKREQIDREIADMKGDKILSYMTLRIFRAGRNEEAIRHANERIPIHMPGEVAGDEDSPLRTPALVTMALGVAGAVGGGAYYLHKHGNPLDFTAPPMTPPLAGDDSLPERP